MARASAPAPLKANPDASLTAVAKAAGVSRSTVVKARDELAAEARTSREAPKTAKPTERRQRAQQFLKDALAHGPKRVSDVEEAAAKAHVEPHALEQARVRRHQPRQYWQHALRAVEPARLIARENWPS